MPAPFVTVVFKDSTDGYEFPVASYLVHGTDDEIVEDARIFAMEAVKSGDYRPDGKLVFDRIERGCDNDENEAANEFNRGWPN